MARALAPTGQPRCPSNTAHSLASGLAALICAAAADSGAVLVNKLLTDGAAVALACLVGRLAIWTGRAVRQALRAGIAD